MKKHEYLEELRKARERMEAVKAQYINIKHCTRCKSLHCLSAETCPKCGDALSIVYARKSHDGLEIVPSIDIVKNVFGAFSE